MKNEKQIVRDAIQFCKGFIEALDWVQDKTNGQLYDKSVEMESLIDQYNLRLKTLKEEVNEYGNTKTRRSKRKNSRK